MIWTKNGEQVTSVQLRAPVVTLSGKAPLQVKLL